MISTLLANIFLHHFDKEMIERGYKLVRFADDFVFLGFDLLPGDTKDQKKNHWKSLRTGLEKLLKKSALES